MCWVSILCNSTWVVASYCWDRHYRISKQILPRSYERLILGTEISNLSSKINSKFLNFKIYKKSSSLIPIFKQSWNEATNFTCQEFSMEVDEHGSSLKTADTTHTGNFCMWTLLIFKAGPYYTVGIPFWTARKRQSQMSKFDGKPQYRVLKSLDHTLPSRTCYG